MPPPVESSRHPPRPRIWLLLSAGWIGPAILGALVAYAHGRLGTRPPVTWRNLLWEGGDWLLYGALTPIVMYLASRWPLRQGTLSRRVPLHLTAALMLGVVWAGVGSLLRYGLLPQSNALSREFLVGWVLTTLPFGLLVYFALVGIGHAVHYFVEARERETQAAQLSASWGSPARGPADADSSPLPAQQLERDHRAGAGPGHQDRHSAAGATGRGTATSAPE